MSPSGRTTSLAVFLFTAAAALAGCSSPLVLRPSEPPAVSLPRDGVQLAQATERIKPGDMLQFRLPDEPRAAINGLYQVAADGTIQLTGEGRVQVGDKTLDEARQMLRSVLSDRYALQAMELTPYEFYMVRVKESDVKRIVRVPLKDGTTVKDALLGAPPLAEKRIWITRPNPDKSGKDEFLTVDWQAITHGDMATNHKLRCGDFLFVGDKPLSGLQRLLDPGLPPTSALEN
jgi:protein involved in polysaccharide export with SLBB domain